MTASLDIGALVYQPTVPVEIKDGSGKKTGWVIQVRGPGHPVMKAANAGVRRRVAEQKRAEARAISKGKVYDADPEEDREFWLGYMTQRIDGWTPVKFSGVDFAFTPENCRRLVEEPEFDFIAQQLREAWADDANFMMKESKNSDSSSGTASPSKSSTGPAEQ